MLSKQKSEFLHKIYLGSVYEVKDESYQLSGIYSTIDDQSVVKKYIHDQFTKYANIYDRKKEFDLFRKRILDVFLEIQMWQFKKDESRLNKAIINLFLGIIPKKTGKHKKLHILDIGSGSGNSVIPLIELYPDSIVVASDLSIELLFLLKKNVLEINVDKNLILIQVNAEELNFRENSFDLIMGSGILHHLFSPDKTLEKCAKILKPGGTAIFYEPFENGNIIMRCIYENILNDSIKDSLSPELINFFRNLGDSFDFRKGRNKSDSAYNHMDDKWLFTRNYFNELAKQYDYSKLIIYSLDKTENIFKNYFKSYLINGIGKNPDDLPEWVLEKVRKYDIFFSEDMKHDLLFDGCIILEK